MAAPTPEIAPLDLGNVNLSIIEGTDGSGCVDRRVLVGAAATTRLATVEFLQSPNDGETKRPGGSLGDLALLLALEPSMTPGEAALITAQAAEDTGYPLVAHTDTLHLADATDNLDSSDVIFQLFRACSHWYNLTNSEMPSYGAPAYKVRAAGRRLISYSLTESIPMKVAVLQSDKEHAAGVLVVDSEDTTLAPSNNNNPDERFYRLDRLRANRRYLQPLAAAAKALKFRDITVERLADMQADHTNQTLARIARELPIYTIDLRGVNPTVKTTQVPR